MVSHTGSQTDASRGTQLAVTAGFTDALLVFAVLSVRITETDVLINQSIFIVA